MSDPDDRKLDTPDCVISSHAVPAEELGRYSVERDPHREKDIANYVEGQARDESVHHVELVKEEVVLGDAYEIWDVTTDKDRWQYLKNTSRDAWQLVNWLTHDRSANKTAASIAIHGSDNVVGHCVQVLERQRTDRTEQCPTCQSRRVRTHFDISIEPDGDYYMTCAACGWNSHPVQGISAGGKANPSEDA